ncbi:MAG: hypothetical protein NVSMB1_26790 [Polyangiales bacterium]
MGSNPIRTSYGVTAHSIALLMPVTVTHDALLGGRVLYQQPSRGYRVSLEAPLLARFAIADRHRPFADALDLGAGPGALALMLLNTGWAACATAVELDPLHASLSDENARSNGVSARFQSIACSVEAFTKRHDAQIGADLVIANPPYFEVDRSAALIDPTRAASRGLTHSSIAAFVRAARKAMGKDARLVIAFPAARLQLLLAALVAAGLHPKRGRFVHPRKDREAQVVFIEAKPGRGGGFAIGPPLVVRGDGEDYLPEVDDALRGRWPVPSHGRASAPRTRACAVEPAVTTEPTVATSATAVTATKEVAVEAALPVRPGVKTEPDRG